MTRVAAALVAAFAAVVVVWTLVNIQDFGVFGLITIALSPFALVGALLIARIPRNAVGWLLSGAGISFILVMAGGEYATTALIDRPGVLPAGELAAGLSQAGLAPAIGLTVLLLLFFPVGHGLGGRWTWVERFFVAFVVFIVVVDLFRTVQLQVGPQTTDVPQMEIRNPFALPGPIGQLVTTAAQLVDKTTLPMVLVAPVSLFVRYRRSSQTEREQIKWLAYSGTLALVLVVLSNLVPGDLGNLFWPIALVVLGTLPVSIAIAIFRYRLYDIDLIIRRTLVYGAVSAVLIASYVAGVALFESLLAPFTAGNGIAVAISTLAVVGLFQPVRRRAQVAVDGRFYRSRYDATRAVDDFSVRLRDEVDLDAVRAGLLGTVGDTMRPTHASLWLKETSR